MRNLKKNIIVSGGDRNTFTVRSAETACFTSSNRGGGIATFHWLLNGLKRPKKWVMILTLFWTSHSSFGQCSFSSPSANPVCSNSPSIALNGYGSPSGGAFSGSGVIIPISPATTYYFNPAAAGAGTHTLTYITMAPACTTTQTITVIALLDITPTPPTYTLTTGGTTAITIVNPSGTKSYYWYENGFSIPGTNTSTTTINVTRMGTFTIIANGPCGTEKVELEVTCDCSNATVDATTYANGYTFTAIGSPYNLGASTTPHTTTDFIFGGTITLQKGAVVTINNANIDMKGCTKIILDAGDAVTSGGNLSVGTKVRLRGCEKWLGIQVKGDANYPKASTYQSILSIAAQDAEVSDAYIAVYSASSGNITLTNALYSNNNADIVLMNNHGTSTWYDFDPTIRDNYFKGSWMHDNSFSCSLSDYATFTGSTNSGKKKMIYIENCKDFNIYDCTFEGNDFLSGNNFVTNAIELKDVEAINLGGTLSGQNYKALHFDGYFNSGIYANNISNNGLVTGSAIYSHNSNYIFDRYYFNTVLDKAIYITNSDNITLGHVQASPFDANRFLGTMNYGTYVTNSSEIKQYENLYNVAAVTTTTGSGGNIGTGIYYKNCSDIDIESSYMADIDVGIFIEDCSTTTTINANHIYTCNDGLHVKNSDDIDITGNEFNSNANYAGFFEDCDAGSYIFDNQITGDYDGFHFIDCDDIIIASNNFDGCTHYTLQYYGDGGTLSSIDGNRFINGIYGLIASPDSDPIGIGAGINTGTINLDITCNLFRDNEYAIVGSGDIGNQGNSTTTNGNEFDNDNMKWELVWEFGGTSAFSYFGSVTASTPNANGTLTYSSINLNGTNFGSPITTSDYFPAGSSTDAACFGTLFIANEVKSIECGMNFSKLEKSMVNQELVVTTESQISTSSNVVCYDALGRIFILEILSIENGKYKFNTSLLATGVNFISINNFALKFFKV